MAPVLKSNAYGHGIVEVGKILDPLGCPFFCVDSIYEAYQLYRAKIKTPVLIMGYVDPNNLKVKHLPFQYCLWDLERARALDRYQKGVKIHIFVDTGMHREGVSLDELEDFLKQIKLLKNITIEGLLTHFAAAEEARGELTKLQIKNFSRAQQIFKRMGIEAEYIHQSNSPGLLTTTNKGCNLARVGKALYGIEAVPGKSYPLKPVLTMTTKIVQIKKLPKGGRVGYGGDFRAPKDMIMGVLPLGYNDGLDRRLSGGGKVKLGDKFCPIIGRISMNITAIDLTQIANPRVGQEVKIISDNPSDPNSIKNIADLCQTIPHDIMVNLVPTTRREVV